MIGERLTELRIKHNMTQEEFAEYMCVTRQSVSKWETDKTYPDVEKLIKISQLYDVSMDYLIRGQEDESGTVMENIDIIKENPADESTVDSGVITVEENAASQALDTSSSLFDNKGTGLKICLGISAVFTLIAIAFIIMFLVQNPWFHSDIREQSVKVDSVYSQLSMVQVSYENEYGDVVTELVLLDTSNIGQGDYINIYANDAGNIFIDYSAGILIAVMVFLVINLCSTVLLVKELSRL